MNDILQLTAEERKRLTRLARYSKQSVSKLVHQGIASVLQAWEDDLVIEPTTGRIIGERTERPGLN